MTLEGLIKSLSVVFLIGAVSFSGCKHVGNNSKGELCIFSKQGNEFSFHNPWAKNKSYSVKTKDGKVIYVSTKRKNWDIYHSIRVEEKGKEIRYELSATPNWYPGNTVPSSYTASGERIEGDKRTKINGLPKELADEIFVTPSCEIDNIPKIKKKYHLGL